MKKNEDNIEILSDDLEDERINLLSEVADLNEINNENKDDNMQIHAKKHLSFELRILYLLALMFIALGLGIFFLNVAFNKGIKNNLLYSDESKVTYSVCLGENNYYKDECLKEGKEYLSLITNHVPVKFEYKKNYNRKTTHNIKYYLIGELKIFDRDNNSKILLEENKMITEIKNYKDTDSKLNLVIKTDVPFKKFNDYVNGYKSRYSLNSLAEYRVVFFVDEGRGTKEVASINMPLGSKTFNIDKSSVNNDDILLTDNSKMHINGFYLFISFVFLLIFIIFTIKLFVLILNVYIRTGSKYKRQLKKILNEYDRVIVKCKNNYQCNKSKDLFEVESFDELLDARDTLEKPIIFEKINSVKSNFYVEDNERIYKYTLKESDFDK